MVAQDPATTAWFGIRLGETSFAIFDVFSDDARREAHLSGKVAKVLMEKASELLAEPPKIEKTDVLADRLPACHDFASHGPLTLPSISSARFYGRGAGVGRGLGLAIGLGVGLGLGVALAAGVDVTVGVAVGVNVGAGVVVAVGVAVGL